MSKQQCGTCRFYDEYQLGDAFTNGLIAGSMGDCRRRAPRINDELLRRSLPGPGQEQFNSLALDLYLPSAFPVTSPTSWCGEHELPSSLRPQVSVPRVQRGGGA